MATKKQPTRAPESTGRPLPNYHPQIEARRVLFQQEAEALIVLLNLQHSTVPEALDIESPDLLGDEHAANILYDAIRDHLRALFEDIIMYYDDEWLRTLYVELRLFYENRRSNFFNTHK